MPRARRARGESSWDRRTVGAIVVAIALVAGLWWIKRPHHSSGNLVALPQSSVALGQSSVSSTVPAPTDRPTPSHESSTPLGAPAPVPVGAGKYETLIDQWDDPRIPVAFDPCRPIHYVVNLTDAPPDGLALIRSGLARVHTATGLHFIDDGTTTEAPTKNRPPYLPDRYGNRWAPVLLAWSRENAYPELAGYIAGIGEARAVYTNNHDRLVYASGQVVLDGQQLSVGAVPDRGLVRAIVLHELGHLVGLDHTTDRREIMFSESQFNVRDYGPGDLLGLARLGTQACFPDT